ncbi:MAG: glycosyltransferase [Pseudomonadota bacterium]
MDHGKFTPNFHIDRQSAVEVAGWASDPSHPDRPLMIRFRTGDVLAGVVRADMVRTDVEAAGMGSRLCGFHWRIPTEVADAAIFSGTPIVIEALNAAGGAHELGRFTLHGEFNVSEETRAVLRPALEGAIVASAVSALSAGGAPLERFTPAHYPLHERMFAFHGAQSGNVANSLSPYLAFTHRRLNKQVTHPLDGSEAAKNAYLRWYIDDYGQARGERRVPLGADEIAYLNAPVPLVGVPYKVSRISLSYAMTEVEAAELFPLSDMSRYEAFVAWWSADKAPDLGVEDCLVPNYYVEALRRMETRWMGRDYPLSQMMLRVFKDEGAGDALDATLGSDRLLFHVWYVLDAIAEPGRLRFVPTRNLNALFDGAPGTTLFDRVIQSVHENGPDLGAVFNARTYSDLLWRKGFDLTRRRFIFADAHGNRFEAARFPPASNKPGAAVPLQVIGPFQKSSGLGQASRLSADTIKRAGLAANFVDFGLDNPAPIGMTKNRTANDAPRPAKINLIHLNGETVPIALSYMRDIFNGAYNIGYFFWELSAPAVSQALSLKLLDEIWVATEYGVSIYKDAVDIPVHNVGMAVEPITVPDRGEARAYVEERLPVGPDTFVVLAAFDSFSFLERKNPHGMVEAFRAAFGPDEDVLLVLKTHNRDFVLDPHQAMRWDHVVEIASRDARIAVMNETLTYDDLMMLKRGADCFLSLHRSEGWGFGLIEAMVVGTPVVATGYSGNMDFTNEETAWPVDYDLVQPAPNEYLFVDQDQVWAAPKLESAVAQLRAVRANKEERNARVRRAQEFVEANFSLDAQARKYRRRLSQIEAMLKERA